MEKLTTIIAQKETSLTSLWKLSGVCGVDVGFKYVKGQRTEEIAIRVLVEHKKKNVPEKQRVPKTIKGIKTDVIERTIVPMVARKPLAEAVPGPDTGKYDPLEGGISIGPDRASGGYVFAGTLGCIVEDQASGEPWLLSNFHVMAVDSAWKPGDLMDQPSRVDGGSASDQVGVLTKAILTTQVDGALCTVSGRKTDCSIVDLGEVTGTAGVTLNQPVRKRGRTTLLTYGFVDAINGTVKIDYGDQIGVKTLTDQIGIRSDPDHNAKFSDHGDSGSVVLDAEGHIVGLLFAGSEDGYTYINQIDQVLSALNIRICEGVDPGTGSKGPGKKGKKRRKRKDKEARG